jgi:hypothetical protein
MRQMSGIYHYAARARNRFDTESEVIAGSRVSRRECFLRRLLRVCGNSTGPEYLCKAKVFQLTLADVPDAIREVSFPCGYGSRYGNRGCAGRLR